MSKKLFIIIVCLILGLFLISLIGYYFIIQNNQGEPTSLVQGFKNFFPFGGNDPIEEPGVVTPNEETPIETPPKNFTQKLRKLSAEPVAGAGTLDIKAGTIVHYIEKATGHIFEVELFSPNQNRISNTTIPVVYDTIWGNKNNSLIARYLKDDDQTVDTYSLSLKSISTTTENTISGIAFPRDISDVSILGDSVFYLVKNNSSSAGYISNFDGSKRKQIWNSEIKELLSQYVNAKTIALTTKPAPNISGFLYFVDTTSGQVKKMLGDVSGLSTQVDSLGTQILFLEQGDGATLSLFDVKGKSTTNITPATFPEKCAWSKKDKYILYCAVPKEFIDGNSLTSWYKGFISYTDDIWKYDLKNNSSRIIDDLSIDSSQTIDVVKPILSENEQYLIFINKIDNTLWSLDLTK